MTPAQAFREAEFQSTPPVKAATEAVTDKSKVFHISIHAAREGGDCTELGYIKANTDISIHAAREGGDVRFVVADICQVYFNPRRP